MTAYYNEIDPFAAAWLRELIKAGHIADGIVDERSIEDVRPDELREFTQCHFFAGIGVWSYALRRAGWPDDRPIWTGSCPCQPFSGAGKGDGFADQRHLWPAFFHLIRECRPAVVAGEQVASKDADAWIDLVQADLEAVGYPVGAVAFPSAGVGAPHIRDRTYWLGHTDKPGSQGHAGHGGAAGWCRPGGSAATAGVSVRLADASGERQHGFDSLLLGNEPGRDAKNIVEVAGRDEALRSGRFLSARELASIPYVGRYVDPGRMADANSQQRPDGQSAVGHVDAAGGREQGTATTAGLRGDSRPGPVNGFWAAADWLLCRDGKWRPVEPGTFPLAHGAPARVGRLRGYGNAINAVAAQVFIEAAWEAIQEQDLLR